MRKDLTNGSPMRLILGFAVPMLLGLLFQQFYNLVDTVIVGKLLGASALAAVGSTGAINFLVLGFCTGLCSGFSIPVAQKVGAGEMSAMRQFVANSAYLSVFSAAIMTTATALGCEWILQMMQTPADIFDNAYIYILVIFLGIPATFLYNLLAGIIRALGDSKTPVYFLALSSGLNIFLDLALILWFNMGVAGAAVATVVSQAISGLACLVFMYKKYPVLRISRSERKLDLRLCGHLFYIGLPMGLQYSVTAIGSILLQSAVNTLGSLSVAAIAAGGKLFQLLCCPFDAMGGTMAVYCGQNVGANKLDRLSKGLWACSILGAGYSVIALVAMVLFAPQCTMLFLDPAEPALAELVQLTSEYIVIQSVFFFPLALVNILRFSIQGMGFSVFAISAGVLEMIGRGSVALWLVPMFGYTAACYAAPVAWVMADLFLIPASARCIRVLRRTHASHAEALASGSNT